jgi:membrane protein required for colicin V production
MAIDIIFIVLMLIAVFKGLQRGLIVAVFSVIACLAGLAAAIKLSAVLADHWKDSVHASSKWIPILAFILVFVVVVLLVRWLANLIEAAVDFVFLEWLNKLGGLLLYIALYAAVYSILLFYGAKSHIIPDKVIASSRVYGSIEPWGPAVINAIGKVIPFFKDMFTELAAFFSRIAQRAS